MDSTALGTALHTLVTDAEPPLRLTSSEVLAAGRRARRRHLLATAGGLLGVGAVAVATTMALLPAADPTPSPAVPLVRSWTGAQLVAEAARFCAVTDSSHLPSRTLPVRPPRQALDQVSCYLMTELGRRFTDARFTTLLPWAEVPLEAVAGGSTITASAELSGNSKPGTVQVAITNALPGDPQRFWVCADEPGCYRWRNDTIIRVADDSTIQGYVLKDDVLVQIRSVGAALSPGSGQRGEPPLDDVMLVNLGENMPGPGY